MSIKVSSVTKTYGEQLALNDVSIEIGAGEVVGFLGPNGAGKSTMMKIISCYIPPTKGTVEVCGFDVMTDSIEVRKKVGYLPEHNPLYLDMYVCEYLEFVAGVYRLDNVKSRVEEMIEMVGLQLERHKLISELSKGYRQRVGLAQAMIHDPEVLILDEPTSGLDPNQLVEIRSLIRKIGKAKTILLSTHILQEVEAICDRVIIINRGEIVANDLAKNIGSLIQGKGIHRVKVEFEEEVDIKDLEKISGVQSVEKSADNTWVLSSTDQNIRKSVFDFAISNNLSIITIQKIESNLEEVFMSLTKHPVI